MFRLRNRKTGLWYKAMVDDDIVWTEYKNQALVFPSEECEFWEREYEDDFEVVRLAEDEIMSQLGMARLPGF